VYTLHSAVFFTRNLVHISRNAPKTDHHNTVRAIIDGAYEGIVHQSNMKW